MKPSVRSLLAAVMCLAAPAFAQTASTLPNHPPGEWRQSLDGPWQFSTRPEPAPTDPVLTVPGNWDTHPEYSTYVGQGWYRRSFDVPADWRGKHVRLCFGAVYHAATVVLNGQEIGRHVGGYTPFEFEVTDRLTYGGVNTLTVCADNTFNRGAWWPWGGISRSVSLVANGDVRVVRQQIDAEPDLKDGSARVSVHYLLSNAGDEPQTVHLASTLDPAAAHLPGATVPIPAHGEQTADVTVLLPKAAVRLWDFDHPNLYHLTTRLTNDAGTVLHEQSDRFGIRKVEVTPEGLFLNGEKIHVCGFNRVSDSNTTGNTEPDVLVRGDVDLMKSAGAVLQRIMHYPQAPDLLDYLDEKGMLIFEEIPVWGGDDPNIKADNPLTEQWMRETITRDYNHPCIIGWSVGNELRNHYAYVHSMIDYTRTLDPHRLLTYISNSASGSGPGHDPIDFCDVAMHNTYGPDPGGLAANLRGKWPKLPVFLSEFGSNQFSEIPRRRGALAAKTLGQPRRASLRHRRVAVDVSTITAAR